MAVHCTVELPIPDRDVLAGVRTFAQLLASAAKRPPDSVRVTLSFIRGTAPIRAWAAQFPRDSAGFSSRAGERSISAAQFLALSDDSLRFGHYSERPPLPPDEMLTRLSALLEQYRRALPSLLLDCDVEWKGAPPGARGKLLLAGLRGSRPRPVGVIATCELPGSTVKAPEFQAAVAAITEGTNVPFSDGTITVRLDEKQTLSANDRVLIACCFDEAIVRTRADVAVGFPSLNTLPQFFSDMGAAFNLRMQNVVAGAKAGRVNADSAFRRTMKKVGDFRSQRGAEGLVFREPLTPALDLIVYFEKIHHFGLGKSFTVILGLQHAADPNEAMFCSDNLSALFPTTPQIHAPAWAYGTAKELDSALSGVERMLELSLSALRKRISDLLDPIPTSLPDFVERRPGLSAREALAIAEPFARKWSDRARLFKINGHADRDAPRLLLGDSSGARGLPWPQDVGWAPGFVSDRGVLHVSVAPLGRIRSIVMRLPASMQPDDFAPPVGPINWIDSDRALAVAVSSLGAAQRRIADSAGRVVLALDLQGRAPPLWRVLYMSASGRVDVTIDPASGSVISVD